jgi:hypothetical protein
MTRFSSNYDPVDARQRDVTNRPEKGLDTEESDCGWHSAQIGSTKNIICAFDTDPHPDISGPRQEFGYSHQSRGTLCKDLEGVLLCPRHDIEDPFDIRVGNVFVKQIAHRVDED